MIWINNYKKRKRNSLFYSFFEKCPNFPKKGKENRPPWHSKLCLFKALCYRNDYSPNFILGRQKGEERVSYGGHLVCSGCSNKYPTINNGGFFYVFWIEKTSRTQAVRKQREHILFRKGEVFEASLIVGDGVRGMDGNPRGTIYGAYNLVPIVEIS